MLYKFFGLIILLISCIFFFYQIYNYSGDLNNLFSNGHSVKTLLYLIVLYAITIVNGSITWFVLMKSFNDFEKPLITCVYIYMTCQLAKYLPGNIGHHLGRIYLTKRYRYNTYQVMTSMVIENLLPIAVSAIFSLYIIQKYQTNIENYIKINIDYKLIVIVLVFAISLFIGLFFIRKRIAGLMHNYIHLKLRFCNILLGFFLTFFNFLALGFILLIWIKSYSEDAPTDFLLITGIFAISWLLGFITPGSPGGIGVREALLVAFLAPIYGNAMAVWLSIMLRISTTLGDGLAFLIGIMLTPVISRQNPDKQNLVKLQKIK